MKAAHVFEQWLAMGKSFTRLVRRTLQLARHKLTHDPYAVTVGHVPYERRHEWKSHTNPTTQLTIILCDLCGTEADDNNYKDACPKKQDS